MNLTHFNEKKHEISTFYDQLLRITTKLDLPEVSATLAESRHNLNEEHFNLVVVGEFSRGKSTFINALLGERILPSATKPTTTLINRIVSGDTPAFTLHYRESEEVDSLDEDAFKILVAPKEPDPDDSGEIREYEDHLRRLSDISHVTISHPSPLLEEGVEIIDTPGTNDLDQAREEITFTFIPRSDAAILLLSATQILSESEMSFLKERILANDIQKVFFVINAKDKLMGEDDEAKVLKYAQEHLAPHVPNPKIFMVSSRGALNCKRVQNGEQVKGKIPATLEETGFPVLEKEIAAYLVDERGKTKLNKHYSRVAKQAGELLKTHIQYRHSALALSGQELEKRIGQLQPVLNHTRAVAKRHLSELSERLRDAGADYVRQYEYGLEEISLRANLAINSYSGPLEADKIARHVESTVAILQKDLDQEMKNYKKRFIDQNLIEAAGRLGRSLDDLDIEVSKALSVQSNLPAVRHMDTLQLNEKFDASSDGLALGGLLVGGAAFLLFSAPFIIIPAALFGGKYLESLFMEKRRSAFINQVKSQVSQRYSEIIPQQVAGFRSSYTKSIQEAVRTIEAQVNVKVNSLDSQLQKLLHEKRQLEHDSAAESRRLEEMTQTIRNIISVCGKETV